MQHTSSSRPSNTSSGTQIHPAALVPCTFTYPFSLPITGCATSVWAIESLSWQSTRLPVSRTGSLYQSLLWGESRISRHCTVLIGGGEDLPPVCARLVPIASGAFCLSIELKDDHNGKFQRFLPITSFFKVFQHTSSTNRGNVLFGDFFLIFLSLCRCCTVRT